MSIHKSHLKEQRKLVDEIKKSEEKKKEESEKEEDSDDDQQLDQSHVDPETAPENSLLDQSAAKNLSEDEEEEKKELVPK